MNDPVYALLRHAMDDDIYLQYIEDPEKFQADRRANLACYESLCALLDAPAKEKLDTLLDGQGDIDSIFQEAAFTTGLAFGLQLLRLL